MEFFVLLVSVLIVAVVLCSIIGFFLVLGARNRITLLEQDVRKLRQALNAIPRREAQLTESLSTQQPAPSIKPPVSLVEPNPPPVSVVRETHDATDHEPSLAHTAPAQSAPESRGQHFATAAEKLRTLRQANPPPAWWIALKEWLFGGNLVAKLGLLILFIGISFLLKYAAARVSVPIELRLAGITLADIGLLLWGWKIRAQRPTIGLPAQGTSLAILMLVTFAAFRLYQLIPSDLAFILLLALTLFTCLLAVLQNAMWLAVFGIIGGFAAPILTATGEGSHIALFSYYTILNAGILGIALLRSWRLLNLLGFAFTFIIGATWGVTRYVPENYLSAQSFLILFFLLYVAISILFALQQAPRLKNYVDGTLIFGVPIVGFGLQHGLVKDAPWGLAFSALVLGLLYITLALTLWQRRGSSLKLLIETFFSLGVVFGTLAIPLALDGRWTSAAWALEGAGVVWIGLRQRQPLACAFGILVQLGAWISFVVSMSDLNETTALRSNLWLGFLLLTLSSFFIATHFHKYSTSNPTKIAFIARLAPLASVFLTLASIGLLAAAWTEIFLRRDGVQQATLIVVSGILVAALLYLIATRMMWRIARLFALLAQIFTAVTFLLLTQLDWPTAIGTHDLFSSAFLGALLIALGASFSSWQLHKKNTPATKNYSLFFLGWSSFWWFGFVLQSLAAWLAHQYQASAYGDSEPTFVNFYFWSSYALWLTVSTPLLLYWARRLIWPTLRWPASAAWLGLGMASVLLLNTLYGTDDTFPNRENWIAYIALWLASEGLIRTWSQQNWAIATPALKCLHGLRNVVPWLLIWPVGHWWINRWLRVDVASDPELQTQLAEAGWLVSSSWGHYLPMWAMLATLGWLIVRIRACQKICV